MTELIGFVTFTQVPTPSVSVILQGFQTMWEEE